MNNKNFLSFPILTLEEDCWKIKNSDFSFENSGDFLKEFVIFEKYDFEKIGLNFFDNANKFLKNIFKNKSEIEMFFAEEKLLQILKSDVFFNFLKQNKINKEIVLSYLFDLKEKNIKTHFKIILIKNFLNFKKGGNCVENFNSINDKENIETNSLFCDIINEKFVSVLAFFRNKIKDELMSNNESTLDKNTKLYENVLEIEIKKVNNKYSAFWVTKKDKSILGLERQALKSKITGIIHYLGSSYEDKYSCVLEISSYDGSSCYKSDLSLSKNLDEKPYIFETEYEYKLRELVDIVNKNFGKTIRWRGKNGETYFRIVSDRIEKIFENNSEENDSDYKVGNYFKNEIEARKILNKADFNNFWEKIKDEMLSKMEKEKLI